MLLLFGIIFIVLLFGAILILTTSLKDNGETKKPAIIMSVTMFVLAAVVLTVTLTQREVNEIYDFEISAKMRSNGSGDQRLWLYVTLPDGTEEKFSDSVALEKNAEKDKVIKYTLFNSDSYDLKLTNETYEKLYNAIYPRSETIKSNT